MCVDTLSHTQRLARLRRDFDESFAAEAGARVEQLESLLTIRAGGEPFAVPTLEIGALAKTGRVVAVPAAAPELLGIAGIAGLLVAVYDLAAIVGLKRCGGCEWMILAGRQSAMALAFEAFEGRVEIGRESILGEESGQRHPYIRRFAQIRGSAVGVIDVTGIAAAIRRQAGLVGPERSSRNAS